jgi:hypothetical protein
MITLVVVPDLEKQVNDTLAIIRPTAGSIDRRALRERRLGHPRARRHKCQSPWTTVPSSTSRLSKGNGNRDQHMMIRCVRIMDGKVDEQR